MLSKLKNGDFLRREKRGRELSFSSEFPYIGRGNILRDGLIEDK